MSGAPVILTLGRVSITVASEGTCHRVKVTVPPGHTYTLEDDALPVVGTYVRVEYTTGADSDSNDPGASGSAYALVVAHESETEFRALWVYNAEEFDVSQRTRLFGRRKNPPFCRALTTDAVTLVNESVEQLDVGEVPPGLSPMVIAYPGVVQSGLVASELQKLVVTVNWYRSLGSKRKRGDIFGGPGHAAQYLDAYESAPSALQDQMIAAAKALYGTPDTTDMPYWAAVDHLTFWCKRLAAAASRATEL
jgi:hypothetical protein